MMFYVWCVLVDSYIYVVCLIVFVLFVCDFYIVCVELFYLDKVLEFYLMLGYYIFNSCVVWGDCVLR